MQDFVHREEVYVIILWVMGMSVMYGKSLEGEGTPESPFLIQDKEDLLMIG